MCLWEDSKNFQKDDRTATYSETPSRRIIFWRVLTTHDLYLKDGSKAKYISTASYKVRQKKIVKVPALKLFI